VTLVVSALTSILTGAFVALLHARTLLLAQILASTSRIVAGVILVILGLGALGVAIGNSFVFIVLFIVLWISISSHLRIMRRPHVSEMKKAARELLEAGSVSWVPNVIYILGTQLGIIVVFGAYGAFEAGVYFIALAILSIIASIYSSIMGVAFPILSGMTGGRKMAIWRAIRLSLVFCMPLTIAALTFPRPILGIFGEAYAVADLTLSVLLFSTIPLIISTGVYTLVYAYGNYRQVFAIGLAGNVPSVVLYFLLTPLLGGLGASYSYLAGAISGVIVSVAVAHRIKMQIIWFDVYKATSIPLIIGSLAFVANLNWLIGGLAILFVSFFGYTRLNLLTKQDMKDLAEAILPRNVTNSIYHRLGWMIGILYG
ncbi:MAG: oligosaccharide flippase family protein, partial [Thaumarchaeota archaeon]|nr:oligosaccharide flippase family protein [Nitrososphaerota archaeon]